MIVDKINSVYKVKTEFAELWIVDAGSSSKAD